MQTIRERIIEQATQLVIRRGWKSLTMDEIANSMGISKRTIYENFANKENLIEQSVFYFLEEGQKKVKAMLDSSDNIIDLIFKQTKCNSESLMKVKYDFFMEIRRYFPSVYDKVVGTFKKEHLQNLEKLLYKGQRDEVFRKDIKVKICASLIQEFIHMILMQDFRLVENRMELTRVFMETFSRGMATETGLQLLNRCKEKKQSEWKKIH
jgi:AcrR family transcriptional regulator